MTATPSAAPAASSVHARADTPSSGPSVALRFWSRVIIGAPDECWEWQGACGHYGHGHLSVGGRTVIASRLAWELTHGPVPEGTGYHGTCVCHSCDNPPCCNPSHLFLGTHQENLADAGRKRRFRALEGRGNPNNRLSPDDVMAIREAHATGESQRSIARRYGLHPSSINRIFNGSAWAWLDGGGDSDGETLPHRGDTKGWNHA